MLNLLDTAQWPFTAEGGALRGPRYIQATKYDYDFTKWSTAWARRNPETVLMYDEVLLPLAARVSLASDQSDSHTQHPRMYTQWQQYQ